MREAKYTTGQEAEDKAVLFNDEDWEAILEVFDNRPQLPIVMEFAKHDNKAMLQSEIEKATGIKLHLAYGQIERINNIFRETKLPYRLHFLWRRRPGEKFEDIPVQLYKINTEST